MSAKVDVADGRVLRGERSREAIVAALFELIGQGFPQPTAEQVAKLAGVQVRTVFRHFADMETLHLALATRLRAELRADFEADFAPGSPSDRARELVNRRARLYERMAPYKRSGNTQRWRYDFLQKQHEQFIRELRAQLFEVLPELEKAPSSVVAALELVTSFEAWDRLRTDQHLGFERARAAVQEAVSALLSGL